MWDRLPGGCSYECRKQQWDHKRCAFWTRDIRSGFEGNRTSSWQYKINDWQGKQYRHSWYRGWNRILDWLSIFGIGSYPGGSSWDNAIWIWRTESRKDVVWIFWWEWEIEACARKMWISLPSHFREYSLRIGGRSTNRAYNLFDERRMVGEEMMLLMFYLLLS